MVYAVNINFLCHEYTGDIKKQAEEVSELEFFSVQCLPEGLDANDRKVIEEINRG